ncbi:fibrinogen-like protein A [Mercenaria mercenaria]|uniref:fibrinogen-like protein A n=1 Tax=Mercenaria mercenaria TaxID=6596 RepID=UPI00234EE960|nr:fibrinogen-like protein A [Mercenaria mercenaria]
MDTNRWNILFGCLLTFIEVLNFISSTGITFVKYSSDDRFIGYRCVPNQTIFEIENMFYPTRCSMLCHLNTTCLSVAYQPETYMCIGCRANVKKWKDPYETLPGSSLYFKPITATDCKDMLTRHYAPSGLYEIMLWWSKKIITVYCDMNTDGGGWTVIHNRFDGTTSFYDRRFNDYENGFGMVNGEFWLGLKHIQELADQGFSEIRLEMTWGTGKYYETYKDFKLLDGTNYTLSIDTGSADRSPGIDNARTFSYNNGYPFTSLDRDMDGHPKSNCAKDDGSGGWWYGFCTSVDLNTRRGGGRHDGIVSNHPLMASRMLIRRV